LLLQECYVHLARLESLHALRQNQPTEAKGKLAQFRNPVTLSSFVNGERACGQQE
jgi:hypothetical protein